MGENLKRKHKISEEDWKNVLNQVNYGAIRKFCGLFAFNALLDLLYNGDIASPKKPEE